MTTSEPSTGLPQQRNFDSPGANQNYNINGKIIISSLAILFFLVFIILFLHVYAKRFWRSSTDIRQQPQRLYGSRFYQETSKTCGLDTEIVVTLPVFTYKSQLSMTPSKAVECAVCLSEFQQDENCKFLPKCKHFFHSDCIDMWFVANTTCPLCRATAEHSVCDEDHEEAGSRACYFTHQDGGNDLGAQHQEASGFASCGGLGCAFGIRDGLACGNINGDEEQGNENGGALSWHQLSQRSQAASRGWRRSISDKFPCVGQDLQFPTNVLFWGNHSHVRPRMDPGNWRIGGRSLPHITIDILRPQGSLVGVSSCPSLCSSPEPRPLLSQSVHSPLPSS